MNKRYQVTNRITKETVTVEAPSAHEACRRAGWMIGDCYVLQLQDVRNMRTERQVGVGDETIRGEP